jgi:hypothetical protein
VGGRSDHRKLILKKEETEMPYKVQFVGLVCFLRERSARRVLLPDGRDPGNGIEPHYASIVVAPDAVEDASGGTFRLPPCRLSIEGADTEGVLDAVGHLLPELRAIDPNFEIDPDRAGTIAQLHLRQGTLEAFRIPGGTALISQLEVPHDGSIHITAMPTDGSPDRTIRVAPGTEIAVTNTAGDDIYASEAEPHGHFRIYERLSVRPVILAAPVSGPAVPASQSQHVLFMRQTPIGLTYECSNTGCC